MAQPCRREGPGTMNAQNYDYDTLKTFLFSFFHSLQKENKRRKDTGEALCHHRVAAMTAPDANRKIEGPKLAKKKR